MVKSISNFYTKAPYKKKIDSGKIDYEKFGFLPCVEFFMEFQ